MIRALGNPNDPSPPSSTPIAVNWPVTKDGLRVVPEDVHFCNHSNVRVAPAHISQHFALDSYHTVTDYACGHKWWNNSQGRNHYFPRLRISGSQWLITGKAHQLGGWHGAMKHLLQQEWVGVTGCGERVGDEVQFVPWIDTHDWTFPIVTPWIGVIHVPHLDAEVISTHKHTKMFSYNYSRHPINQEGFGESLPYCRRLIVLAHAEVVPLRQYLQIRWGVVPKVIVWPHPSVFPDLQLPLPKQEVPGMDWPVMMVGHQSRRLSDMTGIRTSRKRIWVNRQLNRMTESDIAVQLRLVAETESRVRGLTLYGMPEVTEVEPEEYHSTLSHAVIILPLWNATANNSVLEIIGYKIPAFVSRLSATEEYLGKGYPMFYSHPDEISEIIDDPLRLHAQMVAAREYLVRMDTGHLSMEHFTTVVTSTIAALSVAD
jgi:hypothetical protein